MFVSESVNHELQFQKSYFKLSSPLIGGNRCTLQFALRASFWSASFFITAMDGWIKLHQKLSQWEWYQDSKTLHLFIHLLIHANFKARKWQGVEILRGQVLTGLKSLNESTGISVQSLRTSIKRLKSTGEITVESTSQFSIITISNFEKYQAKLTDQPTNQSTSDQQASNKQVTTLEDSIDSIDSTLEGEFVNSPKSKYEKFIDYFNEVKGVETGTKGKFKGDAKSKRQFAVLVKQYSSDEIAGAVQAMFRDSHHRESGYKWATPELITRADKFARFLGT